MKTPGPKSARAITRKQPPYDLRTPREVILVYPGEQPGDPDELVTIVDPTQITGAYWGSDDLAGAKVVKSDGSHHNPYPAVIKKTTKGKPAAAVPAAQGGNPTPLSGTLLGDTDLLPPSCYWDGTQWICC